MPPLPALEDYLALLAAVEATAAELGMTIVLEGYPPPRDPRLKVLQVTPDPESSKSTYTRPQAGPNSSTTPRSCTKPRGCHACRPRSSCWTGGIRAPAAATTSCMGGATAGDSPFLRRPDLLGSLIAYWHNHPSLSYLFSGLFIGPTSQAPRVDEARNDQVYELEIALAELRRRNGSTEDAPPWLVDRALRNILIDVTGNTHRAEFCIDKLYSPRRTRWPARPARNARVRNAPHWQMSLRSNCCYARCWRAFGARPTRSGSRAGTELHDRFLLPTFVALDFEDVLRRVDRGGLSDGCGMVRAALRVSLPAGRRRRARGVACVSAPRWSPGM